MAETFADELAALWAEVRDLRNEVRLLRRGRPRADADAIEALLGYIADEHGHTSWAAKWLLDGSSAHPLLRGAIVRCIGEQPTPKGLSRFLGRHLGQWGDFVLRCTNPHSSDGVRYCVTLSRKNHASLLSEERKL